MAVGWTNIFMKLTTSEGEIDGEGEFWGFEKQIELYDFQLGFKVQAATSDKAQHSKGTRAGADETSFDMQPMEISKRFDLSSPSIMRAIDNDLQIKEAVISVLGVMQMHQWENPAAVVLTLEDGYFLDIETKLAEDGKGASVIETIHVAFSSVRMRFAKEVRSGPGRTDRRQDLSKEFFYKKRVGKES